jgi:phospholipid/cholesterol/gamma-HCH transport system permease protein
VNLLTRLVRTVGRAALAAVAQLGAFAVLIAATTVEALRPPRQPRRYSYQLLQVGVGSLGLAVITAGFAGAVLALQFGHGLERFGARIYLGQTTVTALFRELGPILTALVAGARVAAGIAAELGSMAVTEQIDAMRTLGSSPLSRLVAPRLVATTVALPLLAVCADAVGFVGALLIARAEFGVSSRLFLRGVFDFVTLGDFFSGLIKAVAFGFLIGAVACSAGLSARGGTEGVGRATTRAVVAAALVVLAADLGLTRLLINME